MWHSKLNSNRIIYRLTNLHIFFFAIFVKQTVNSLYRMGHEYTAIAQKCFKVCLLMLYRLFHFKSHFSFWYLTINLKCFRMCSLEPHKKNLKNQLHDCYAPTFGRRCVLNVNKWKMSTFIILVLILFLFFFDSFSFSKTEP